MSINNVESVLVGPKCRIRCYFMAKSISNNVLFFTFLATFSSMRDATTDTYYLFTDDTPTGVFMQIFDGKK